MTNTTSLWWILGGLAVLLAIGGAGLAITPAIVQKIGNAIAIAENGSAAIQSGNVPNNNPGNITDGQGNLMSYASLSDGWAALYNQVQLILSGSSPYYPGGGSMTIAQVAAVYVGTSDAPNWAHNVAAVLGVSINTPLDQVS